MRLSQYRGKPLLVSFHLHRMFPGLPAHQKRCKRRWKTAATIFGTGQYNVISIGLSTNGYAAGVEIVCPATSHSAAKLGVLSPHPSIVGPLTQAFGFRYAATPAGFDHLFYW